MTLVVAKPPTLQTSLIEALSGRDPERALEQSFIQLSRGGDLPLLLAMLKALVRAGMAGLAVELIQSVGGVLANEPQLCALADHLSSLPSGEIESAQLRDRCRSAAAFARRGREHLQQHLDDADAYIQEFRAFRSVKGNVHLLRRSSARRLEFVLPFVDQASLADAMKLPPVSLATSFLFIGVPSPILWQRIVDTREASGYLPPIDLVETDGHLLATWLGLIEDPAALEGDRVSIFAGSNAVEEYRRYLVQHPWRTPATHALTNHRPHLKPPVIDRAFSDSVSRERDKRNHHVQKRMHDRHAGKDVAWWRARFQEAGTAGPPLRIIGLTTRFSTVIQHAMRDLAGAFKRRGCEFDLVMQPNPSCATVDVVGAMADKDYDLIVVINHARSEFGDSMPANVPYLCWIQDHMDQLHDPKTGRSIGELDMVLTHSPDIMASLYGYPVERVLGTSNLTDTTTYQATPILLNDRLHHACDVSFASHGSESPDQMLEAITRGSSTTFKAMMGRMLEMLKRRMETQAWITPPDQLQMLLDAERETGHPPIPPEMRRGRVFPQAARLYDRIFRHQALQWVGDWAHKHGRTFRLYGRGWEYHQTLAQFACGEITPGPETRCLYQASAITLQINGYGSLHQRLLDALASGGFVLSRFNPADFLRQPFTTIQRCIRSHGLQSLDELLNHSRGDADLQRAIAEVSELTGLEIAPADSPLRAARIALSEETNGVRELRSDKGLFTALKSLQFIPQRTAGEIPDFAATTFCDRPSLECLLDRYVDDSKARGEISRPMQQAVILHDTHDLLVERVLNSFFKS